MAGQLSGLADFSSAIQGFGRRPGRGTRLALLQVMVRLTTSQNNDLVELRVEGELTESTTHELEQLSRSYLGLERKLVLRLAGATFADRTGVALLRSLEKKGVMLAECSGFLSELLHRSPDSSFV